MKNRELKGAELSYSTQENELLAIKHILRLWDRYAGNGQTTTIIANEGRARDETNDTFTKQSEYGWQRRGNKTSGGPLLIYIFFLYLDVAYPNRVTPGWG